MRRRRRRGQGLTELGAPDRDLKEGVPEWAKKLPEVSRPLSTRRFIAGGDEERPGPDARSARRTRSGIELGINAANEVPRKIVPPTSPRSSRSSRRRLSSRTEQVARFGGGRDPGRRIRQGDQTLSTGGGGSGGGVWRSFFSGFFFFFLRGVFGGFFYFLEGGGLTASDRQRGDAVEGFVVPRRFRSETAGEVMRGYAAFIGSAGSSSVGAGRRRELRRSGFQ